MAATKPTYDIGDGIRISVAFSDINGVPADPDVIVIKVLDPAGTLTTPPIFRTGRGLYYADMIIPSMPGPGTWNYRWEGTGAVTAAEEGQFAVRPSVFY